MCWNEQVSFLSYIIIVIVVIVILQQNPSPNVRWQSYFLLTVVTIQLLEGFLWISIKNENDKFNAAVTAIVLLALWAQPLVNSYLGYKIGSTSSMGHTILYFTTILFAVLFLYNLYIVTFANIDFITETTESCHLNWQRSDTGTFPGSVGILPAFYIAGLLLPLLLMLPRREGLIFFTAGLITLGLASYRYGQDGSFSSMWCFLAILYAIAIILAHNMNK